jgi:hypothetical protein
MAEGISHHMPESLRRVAKGEYEVRGTELRIVQGEGGKWTVTGHSDDLGAFGSRGAALGKLQELGLVPAQPAEPEPKAEEPKVTESTQGVGGRKATGERTPRPRKPRTRKAAATASA